MSNNKRDIVLIGGGGHCKSCIDVIEQSNDFKIIGILDVAEKVGSDVSGYTIVGEDKDLDMFNAQTTSFLITIGQIHSSEKRKEIAEILNQKKLLQPIIVSPRAYVSKNSVIKKGTIIMHDAIINAGATVGENCIINSKALIEHDVIVGNNCHISTGAIVNGHSKIGEDVFIGSNSTIVNNISVKEKSINVWGFLLEK